MQTINLTIPDQYDIPLDQPLLIVSLPDHWKEFIAEGHLESMLLDYAYVWDRECDSNSMYCTNVLFKLFIDLVCDGYIARRSDNGS